MLSLRPAKMSEKFSLKWNDFQSNISKTFSSLREDEDFPDVILVSADHHQVSAHRLVLSACSQYFNTVLRRNKHSNPLLCLDGVSYAELQSVLDYIYQGEVQVHQHQLDRFLAVAERFQLSGLTNLPDLPDSQRMEENIQENEEERFVVKTPQRSYQRPDQTGEDRSETKYKSDRPRTVKPELTPLVNIDPVQTPADIDEVEAKLRENIVKAEDGTFSCKLCGKSGVKHSRNMKNHVETHMEGLSFPCQMCGKTFRSSHILKNHKYREHKKNANF